jgi:hypothetical protein
LKASKCRKAKPLSESKSLEKSSKKSLWSRNSKAVKVIRKNPILTVVRASLENLRQVK